MTANTIFYNPRTTHINEMRTNSFGTIRGSLFLVKTCIDIPQSSYAINSYRRKVRINIACGRTVQNTARRVCRRNKIQDPRRETVRGANSQPCAGARMLRRELQIFVRKRTYVGQARRVCRRRTRGGRRGYARVRAIAVYGDGNSAARVCGYTRRNKDRRVRQRRSERRNGCRRQGFFVGEYTSAARSKGLCREHIRPCRFGRRGEKHAHRFAAGRG